MTYLSGDFKQSLLIVIVLDFIEDKPPLVKTMDMYWIGDRPFPEAMNTNMSNANYATVS